MSEWTDLFGGAPTGDSLTPATTIGDNTSYFTLPDFTQPTFVSPLAPSFTTPDTSPGIFSSVGSLFSNAGNGIANATSSTWNSVANWFGGSTAPNSSASAQTGTSGTGMLSSVASIFKSVEGAVGTALQAGASGAKRTAGFGGTLVGKFLGGVVGGAGIPTLLVILAIVAVVAYVWSKRL